ncbi:MAG: alpha/beta hydrolase [Acidobacteriia bacterium]|nr:alpha/beta hydrolase [Terriglobia bacterium]
MNANAPGKSSPAVRIIVRLLIALVILVVALGLTLWRAPLWVAERLTQFQLLRAAIHSRSMVIDGNDVHYIEGGSGQPIVLIHGLGSQAQQDWVALAPYLVRAGYHVYALDLLGYGQSAKPADRTYSIPEEAKFVESFLNANHLDTVALGGVSMGGWIASTVALDQPQRVTRLMLFDSAGMWFKLSFDPALFTPQTSQQVNQLMALVTPDPPALPEFVKADFIRRMKRDGWVVRRALVSMMAGGDELDEKFSALKMPMLIVWGKEDTLTPLSLAESMHRAAPQSVLVVYGDCGHIAVVTCMDRIAPTALDFLSGTGRQPGQTIEVPAPTR